MQEIGIPYKIKKFEQDMAVSASLGYCNPTRTSNNSMQNHPYGFVLDNNGIIVQQGTPIAPADNKWLGTNWNPTGGGNGNYKHTCLNLSDTDFSKMYVRSGSSYTPIGSVTNAFGSNPYTSTNNPITLFTVNNPPFFVLCSISTNPGGSSLTTSDLVEALEENADSIALSTEVSKVQTYRALDADTTLMDSSAILSSFYDGYENSNTAKLLEVEEAAGQDDNTLAQSTMNSVLPENTVEESYKLYYEALLHYQDSSFSEADSSTLIDLARGCPTLQGSAVVQAASLYNAVYQTAEVFENTCPEYLDKKPEYTGENWDENAQNEAYQIYPIPNKGSFFLKGKLASNYLITIINTLGSVVYKLNLSEESNEEYIQTHLGSGTYVVILRDANGNNIYYEKIIIIE